MDEKFTKRELEVFNMIRSGKSKSDIVSSGITTTGYLNTILCGIYEKTDSLVGYHSARNKFEELVAFLRNNPTAFTPIPEPDEGEKLVGEPKENNDVRKFVEILNRLGESYRSEVQTNKIKLSVLDDINAELGRV